MNPFAVALAETAAVQADQAAAAEAVKAVAFFGMSMGILLVLALIWVAPGETERRSLPHSDVYCALRGKRRKRIIYTRIHNGSLM